jgi:hypothetical protein
MARFVECLVNQASRIKSSRSIHSGMRRLCIYARRLFRLA